jgi:glutamine amidotransferase
VKSIGVIDYGFGNHSSVVQALRRLDYRVKLSSNPAVLDEVHALVLPGVGAFPPAMKALNDSHLINYILDKARAGKPILGICLGMQLLTTGSHEHGYTPGLNLIPGEVLPTTNLSWHIGWNALNCIDEDPIFRPSHGKYFYFNHSYVYNGPTDYRRAHALNPMPLTAVIRKDNICGVQFHPEKSQAAGQAMLRNVIEGLTHA